MVAVELARSEKTRILRMTEEKLCAVEQLIKRLYDEAFDGEVRFGPVFASFEDGRHGDYIRVRVIYDSPTGQVDPEKTIGLIIPTEEHLEDELGITIPAVVTHVDHSEEKVWTPDVFRTLANL